MSSIADNKMLNNAASNSVNNFLNDISNEANTGTQISLDRIQECYNKKVNMQYEYLVRGAILICSCGSHRRMLNLPVCHGVYINDNPLLHYKDNITELQAGKKGCNITHFGVCETIEIINPGGEIKVYKKTLANSADGVAGLVKGYQCRPIIISNWFNSWTVTKMADNASAYAIEGSGVSESLAAITTNSFLVCKYGGIISAIYSGQQTPLRVSDCVNSDDYYSLTGKEKPNLDNLLTDFSPAPKKENPEVDKLLNSFNTSALKRK